MSFLLLLLSDNLLSGLYTLAFIYGPITGMKQEGIEDKLTVPEFLYFFFFFFFLGFTTCPDKI